MANKGDDKQPADIDLTSTDANALLAFSANENELRQIRSRIDDASKQLAEFESTSELDKQLSLDNTRLQEELKEETRLLEASVKRYNDFLELFRRVGCRSKLPDVSNKVEARKQECHTCQKPTAGTSSVTCHKCQLQFHGECLTPPISVKRWSLAKKKEWQCADCKTKEKPTPVAEEKQAVTAKTTTTTMVNGTVGTLRESKRRSLAFKESPVTQVKESSQKRKRASPVTASPLLTPDKAKSPTTSPTKSNNKRVKRTPSNKLPTTTSTPAENEMTPQPPAPLPPPPSPPPPPSSPPPAQAVTIEESKATTGSSPKRISVIKQLFTRKSLPNGVETQTGGGGERLLKKKTAPAVTSQTVPPATPPPSSDEVKPPPSLTPVSASPSLPAASSPSRVRKPTKTPSERKEAPVKMVQKKKRQSKKKQQNDPLSIFDFYDEDFGEELVELRSVSSMDNVKVSPPASSAVRDEKTATTKKRNTKMQKKEEEEEPAVVPSPSSPPKIEDRGKGTATPRGRASTVIKNNVPQEVKCVECNQHGASENMTDCDVCKNFYHFACCAPPLLAFPKRRNYGWSCHRCSPDSEQEEEGTTITAVANPITPNKRERKSNVRLTGAGDYVME